MFNPEYKLTNKIVKMLTAIAEARAVIERAKLLPKQELKLKRQAIIRMTYNSTAIEGNRLNIREVEYLYANKKVDASERDIFEVKNYLNALKYIGQITERKELITEKILLKIHKLVTAKTLANESAGHYRKGPVYVVRRRLGFPDQVMYTGPSAKKVPELCRNLIKWIQQSEAKEIDPVITAGIVHHEVAAIHPFNDGNGRTARALATLILYKRGYDFRQLFALEDYYNKERPKYYQAINTGDNYNARKTDLTIWLEYFTTGFKEEIDNVKNKVIALSARKVDGKIKSQIYLDKNQLKIIDFLDNVGKINVNDVVDILNCPKRTAQLCLQKLKKTGIIKQVGKGPASAYVMK